MLSLSAGNSCTAAASGSPAALVAPGEEGAWELRYVSGLEGRTLASAKVTVKVDAAGLQFSSMDSADEGEPVCLLGLVVHMLVAGATFTLHSRRASAGSSG